MRPDFTISGVIFDLDVLVSTDSLHTESWRELAQMEGIQWHDELAAQTCGVGWLKSLEAIINETNKPYSLYDKQRLADWKRARFLEKARQLTPKDRLPGATELLANLTARGVRIAVASESRNAGLILERVGLQGAFDSVIDGTCFSHSKPYPEIYQVAANQLGLPSDQCLVVEETEWGIEAAHRAGMVVLGVGKWDTVMTADRVVLNLEQAEVDQVLSIKPFLSLLYT